MKNNTLIITQIVVALSFAGISLAHADTDCTQVTQIPLVECEALLDFYHSTDGANWVKNDNWNETNTPCDWFGVSCTEEHVTVLRLSNGFSRNMGSNGLSGVIPESISNLSYLEELNLNNNQLTGLPDSFGDLSNLKSFDLSENQLTSLPESFGSLSNLKNLYLSDNLLTGLPNSFGSLSNLKYLLLYNNQLMILPESFGDLSSLKYLDLSDNQLCDLPLSIINLSPKKVTNFDNNDLMISNLDLINWLNQNDNDWASSQTSRACGALQPEPGSYHIGQLDNNQQAYQLFTMTNTSDQTAIHINTVTILGDQAAEFTQSKDVDYQCTDKSLAPGEACYEYISFMPTGEGEKQAYLSVSSDDLDYPEFNVSLSAIVGDPDVVQTDRACLTEIPTLQTINSGLWDNVWGDMDGNPVSYLPGDNDVLLINQGHSVISLPQVKINALCNKGELRSAVGKSLEIIASNGISNYGSIIGESGQTHPETHCGTPGSDVILKAGKRFERTDKHEDWWWFGEGNPIYNSGTIKAGNGGNGEECTSKGGDVLVLGRNVTNDYNATIFAGHGGNTSIGTGGRGGVAQIWGKLGGLGNLVSRGQVYGGNGGNGSVQGGDGGNLWLVSLPNVYLGHDRGHTVDSAAKAEHFAGQGGQGTRNGQGGNVIIEPPVIALTQGIEIKGENVTIFGGDEMTLDFSNLTETAITATGDILLSVGEQGVINFEGTTAAIFSAAGNVTIRANHIVTDAGVELADIIQANEIIKEPGQNQREILLTGPSVLIGEPNTSMALTFTLTNNGPTADVYDLTISDTTGWDLGNTLPDSVNLDGLTQVEFNVYVTFPANLGEGNLISVVATSQTEEETVISVADVQIITNFVPEVPIEQVKPVLTINKGTPTVVEPKEPTDEMLEIQKPVEPTTDQEIPDETLKPVEPTTNDGMIETPKPVELTTGDRIPDEISKSVEPMTNDEDEIQASITTTDDSSIAQSMVIQSSGCSLVGEVFNEVCNAGGRRISHLKTLERSNLSNAVLEGILTNNGWVSNFTITHKGHLIGGKVTGYIVNNGLMENFEFRGASIIGGTLGGIVTNLSQVKGYFKDVHLAPATHLIGAELQGEIKGDEAAPAIIKDSKIDEDAVLANLIIEEGTDFEKGATIGKGVRFANNTLVPEELNLTDALLNSDGTIDLNSDIIAGSDVPSLLQQINQLPDMLVNGWQLKQDTKTDKYYVMVNGIRIVVFPLQVKQAQGDSRVKLKIHSDGVHVTLVTVQKREILVKTQVDTSL